MVRYCLDCCKKCGKGEYKQIQEITYAVRKDYSSLKSFKETPHFYIVKKTRASYCLECIKIKNEIEKELFKEEDKIKKQEKLFMQNKKEIKKEIKKEPFIITFD